MEEIMLSIVVPTYGHEKYILQTLESIRMQKTKYKYEVLVGEDASPDNTRKLLKEYEKEHPGMCHMLYRKENMNKSSITNARDLLLRCKGKYVIVLEGDDYWISEDKIEHQIEFLETHPDYIAVAHNCVVVDENGKETNENYPECKNTEYSIKEFFYNVLPGQTATVMHRNYVKENLFDTSLLEKGLVPGDKLRAFALIMHGKIYCIQEKMSAYRHVRKGGSSFSANFKYDIARDLRWHEELLQYAYKIGNGAGMKCAEIMYFDILIRALTEKYCSFGQIFRKYIKLHYKCLVLIGFLNKRIVLKINKEK